MAHTHVCGTRACLALALARMRVQDMNRAKPCVLVCNQSIGIYPLYYGMHLCTRMLLVFTRVVF